MDFSRIIIPKVKIKFDIGRINMPSPLPKARFDVNKITTPKLTSEQVSIQRGQAMEDFFKKGFNTKLYEQARTFNIPVPKVDATSIWSEIKPSLKAYFNVLSGEIKASPAFRMYFGSLDSRTYATFGNVSTKNKTTMMVGDIGEVLSLAVIGTWLVKGAIGAVKYANYATSDLNKSISIFKKYTKETVNPQNLTGVYRKLALQYHPDIAGAKGTKIMSELNTSYNFLANYAQDMKITGSFVNELIKTKLYFLTGIQLPMPEAKDITNSINNLIKVNNPYAIQLYGNSPITSSQLLNPNIQALNNVALKNEMKIWENYKIAIKPTVPEVVKYVAPVTKRGMVEMGVGEKVSKVEAPISPQEQAKVIAKNLELIKPTETIKTISTEYKSSDKGEMATSVAIKDLVDLKHYLNSVDIIEYDNKLNRYIKTLNTHQRELVAKKQILPKGEVKAIKRQPPVAQIPKELEPLAKEARKYKSAEEFSESIRKEVSRKFGIENPSDKAVSDYFEALQKGYTGGAQIDLAEHLVGQNMTADKAPQEILQRTFPGGIVPKEITVYRGQPGGRELVSGDFITLDRSTASTYGKVQSFKIKPSELVLTNKPTESLYYNPDKLPTGKTVSLTDFYNQAVKQPTKAVTYKEAKKIPKGGAVESTKTNLMATGADIIGHRFGILPEAVYNWAVKQKVDLTNIEQFTKLKAEQITNAILNNNPLPKPVKKVEKVVEKPISKKEPIKFEGTWVSVKSSSYRDIRILLSRKKSGIISDKEWEKIVDDYLPRVKAENELMKDNKKWLPIDIRKEVSKPTEKERIEKPTKGVIAIKEKPKGIGMGGVNPIEKVIQALKEAKSLRAEQEKIYTQERTKRLTKAQEAGKIGGEAGYYAELAQLKGEMFKVQFENIRSKVTQEDINALFNLIEESSLRPFQKITTKKGLAKLFGEFGGTVPTEGELKLLNKIFPELVKTLLTMRPFLDKLKNAGYEIANIPRALMASFDLSAPLRQGVFLLASRPKEFTFAFGNMFRYVFSEKNINTLMDIIAEDPLYDLITDYELALTDINGIMREKEEVYMSNWAEKIPLIGKGVRASDRAYTGFLNYLRYSTFKSLFSNAEKAGLNPRNDPKYLASLTRFINSATGRGDISDAIKGIQPLLNGFLFSPRLIAARINLLNPVFYARLDPPVRKEALKSLLAFVGAGITILSLLKLTLKDKIKIGTDWRSADFGKIKIENTRIDIWGGFQQYVRLVGQLVTGEYISTTTGVPMTLGEGYKPITRFDILMRFFEYKEAPFMSLITDLLKGQTAIGEPLSWKEEILNRVTPMVMQDFIDIAKDDPDLLPLAIFGIFGVGIQTYGLTYTKSEEISAELLKARGVSEKEIDKIFVKERIKKQINTQITFVKNNEDLTDEEKINQIDKLHNIYETLIKSLNP